MISVVIFDMDGVLVDSEDAMTHASMDALEEFGVHAAYDDFKKYTGMGEDKFLGCVAKEHGVPYTLAMKDRAYEIYVARAKDRVKVYPWSHTLIRELKSRGFRVAVASAADRVKVRCNLLCIGVTPEDFDAVITGGDVQRLKPAPDIFLRAAEAAGGGDALVVEDALSGVTAAKAAGMKAVAVTTSFSREALEACGADAVVDDLSQALELPWLNR